MKIYKERSSLEKRIADKLAHRTTLKNRSNLVADINPTSTPEQKVPPVKQKVHSFLKRGNRFSSSSGSNSNLSWKHNEYIATEVSTPDWFRNDEDVDVSIIIPIYKSQDYIRPQVQSWSVDESISWEIIYVNDSCPLDSYKQIIPAWESKKQSLQRPVGKIIKTANNAGFAGANNCAFKFAKGKYICFLNADTTVTPGWLKSLLETIESNPQAGIVGNLQYSSDGKIDSLGSEWSWELKSFPHIGKNILDGETLRNPLSASQVPERLMKVSKRDMVTGCCMMIRREVWEAVGGFDTIYKTGYWEDSDICMKIKSLGYDILFDPNSRITHVGGHTKSSGNPNVVENAKLFRERWVNTRRIDSLVSSPRPTGSAIADIKKQVDGDVRVCVIACNEEEFLKASADSVAPFAKDFTFVIGGNNYAYKSGMCDALGYPTDSTLEIAYQLTEKYGGRVIEPPGRPWKDKVEQRNAYANFLNDNDWLFILDGDEVYDVNQLWRLTELMKNHEALIMQYYVFWNDVNTLGTTKWMTYPQERMVKWRSGYKYHNKNHLNVSDKDGRLVHQTKTSYRGNERLFYHYSWVRPIEKIQQKLDYYYYQTGNDNRRYVEDVFLQYRKDPQSVIGRTHPMGGGGFERFAGIHPPQVQELIASGKLNF